MNSRQKTSTDDYRQQKRSKPFTTQVYNRSTTVLQQVFTSQFYKLKLRVQTQRKAILEIKTSFKTIRQITSMSEDELHILPTDVRLTCPHFTAKTGPTRPTNPEEVVDRSTRRRSLRSPPERTLLKYMATTSLSILILSKTYPTMGILSPLSRHAKLFGSGVILLKSC